MPREHTPRLTGGVVRSLCQQLHGRGDIVLAIFGQCRLPHPACMGGRWGLTPLEASSINEGGIWWVNAGLLSFRGTVPRYTGQAFQAIPAGLNPNFNLSTVPAELPFAFPIFVSPPFLYFLQPSPSSARRPCSPGKTNQDTQFPHLKKPLKWGCKIWHLHPKAVK